MRVGMDRHNQFLEPDRGGGIVSWAVKQLVMWSVAGFVVYIVVGNHQLFRTSAPEPAPHPAVASANNATDDPPSRQTLRPLGQAAPVVTNSLSLRAQADGYAYVKASVNGADMVMAFDTGASEVSLTKADATKAGVAGNLNYSLSFTTANGRGRGAPVMLREIRIGQLVIPDVHAVVMENMQTSLLGQTFLSRLHSYQMQNGVLTLTWQQ
jgi:clan AA aspartic protease (TIGR02281 family)